MRSEEPTLELLQQHVVVALKRLVRVVEIAQRRNARDAGEAVATARETLRE